MPIEGLNDMQEWTSHDTIIAIFTAITSIGIFIQACVLIAVYFGARKVMVLVTKLVEDAREHVLPTLATSRSLIDDLSPKIKVMATNFTEVSHTIRHQTEHINTAVTDVVDRTHKQAQRVDGMVTGTMDGITNATASIQEGISMPVRKVNAFLNGVRAALDVLLQRARTDHAKADHDLFV
jgi:methyl-accepting chemotaxis protein